MDDESGALSKNNVLNGKVTHIRIETAMKLLKDYLPRSWTNLCGQDA